jgi:hypothetical protein
MNQRGDHRHWHRVHHVSQALKKKHTHGKRFSGLAPSHAQGWAAAPCSNAPSRTEKSGNVKPGPGPGRLRRAHSDARRTRHRGPVARGSGGPVVPDTAGGDSPPRRGAAAPAYSDAPAGRPGTRSPRPMGPSPAGQPAAAASARGDCAAVILGEIAPSESASAGLRLNLG